MAEGDLMAEGINGRVDLKSKAGRNAKSVGLMAKRHSLAGGLNGKLNLMVDNGNQWKNGTQWPMGLNGKGGTQWQGLLNGKWGLNGR